jgi:hypothetical protein
MICLEAYANVINVIKGKAGENYGDINIQIMSSTLIGVLK